MDNNKSKTNEFYEWPLKKIDHILNIIKINLKISFSLPHIWVLLIILFFSFVSLYVALINKENNIIFSIYSNIFAGLITGLTISLISFAKGVSLYKNQSKKNWLIELQNKCFVFFNRYNELCLLNNSNLKLTEQFYENIYDLLCLGNDVCGFISCTKFSKYYPFNVYKFCKKELNFNVFEKSDENNQLRDKIMNLTNECIDNNFVKNLFKDMHKQINSLNIKINKEMKNLDKKIKIINLT